MDLRCLVLRLSVFLLILLFVLNFSNQINGQEKLNLSVGIGFPELLNLGVPFQIKQFQFGLNIGTLPFKLQSNTESVVSTGVDFGFHFAGVSNKSKTKPWFSRVGANYIREVRELSIYDYIGVYLRFGRDINFTNKVGVSLEAGFLFKAYENEERKDPTNGYYSQNDVRMYIYPSTQISVFYKL